MIIKADNRGRLALGKAAGGSIYDMSHTEWNVEYKNGGFTVQPHPEPEETQTRWVNQSKLNPELIGQTIYVEYDKIPGTEGSIYRDFNSYYTPRGLVGILEWYQTCAQGIDIKAVKLAGHDPIEFENYGLFWVRV